MRVRGSGMILARTWARYGAGASRLSESGFCGPERTVRGEGYHGDLATAVAPALRRQAARLDPGQRRTDAPGWAAVGPASAEPPSRRGHIACGPGQYRRGTSAVHRRASI